MFIFHPIYCSIKTAKLIAVNYLILVGAHSKNINGKTESGKTNKVQIIITLTNLTAGF